MSHYIEKVTVSLENLISELARNPSDLEQMYFDRKKKIWENC